jgi:glutathione S-transferase
MPQYTSMVTMIVVLFYFFIATRVPLARRKYNVQLPAIHGHPDFERVFRVTDAGAAALGALWIVGRFVYYVGYAREVQRRLPGFFIQSIACLLLIVGAIAGMISRALP